MHALRKRSTILLHLVRERRQKDLQRQPTGLCTLKGNERNRNQWNLQLRDDVERFSANVMIELL